MLRESIAIVLLLSTTTTGLAADFYVDPQNGDSANDGSAANPWKSLQAVIDRNLVESRDWASRPHKAGSKLMPKNRGGVIKAGDTIWLRSGDYDDVFIQGYYNTKMITITAQAGHTPRFRSFRLRSSANWTIKGLHVSPEFGEGEKPRTLIVIEAHNWRGPIHDVVVEDCVLRSAADTANWTAADWNKRACSGIQADGTRVTLRNNRLKNVNFGISVTATHALVERNVVENFAGDGLRGLGDHSVFQYNLVKNCYDVNANHDDGFQSWSTGPDGVGTGEVVGIVLRGNTIINFEDPRQPHRGTLQGIGCFDGMFVDWVVENNVVVVDHWHGITLLGARGCRIVNNTVIDPNEKRPGPPWVRIGKHKNGTPPVNCTIRNNLATSLNIDKGKAVTADHNLIAADLTTSFMNVTKHDLRLRAGSPAIDAGHRDLAPRIDITQTARPQGRGVDIGAYERPVK